MQTALRVSILALALLKGASATWADVSISPEYKMDSNNDYVLMYPATEHTACMMTGMYSSSGGSYSCEIVKEEETGLSGVYWKIRGSGPSSNQVCRAYCISWESNSAVKMANETTSSSTTTTTTTPADDARRLAELRALANTTTGAGSSSSGPGPTGLREFSMTSKNSYTPMVDVDGQSVCFLTGMYSSSGDSYECYIAQEAGQWTLHGSGNSGNQFCYAACLEGLAHVEPNTVSGITDEFSVEHKDSHSYMSSTANNAACFLTGMYSSSGDSYTCQITTSAVPDRTGTYWELTSSGKSGNQFCYARCLPFLTWNTPVGYWEKIHSVGYGSFEQDIAYGVSSTDTTATTETWGESVTTTMENGVEFDCGFSSSVSVSYEASYSIAQSVSNALTHDQSITRTVTCTNTDKYLSVFQWVSTLSHPEDEMSETEVVSSDYFCLLGENGNETPQCPLGYCASGDATCQTCADGWEA